MLVALGSLSAHQTQATENMYLRYLRLLDYSASHPDTTIRYVTSDIVLHIYRDASYLYDPKYRSRSGGYYFFGNRSPVAHQPPYGESDINGPIFTLSNILSNVMASAAEAKIGDSFLNGQESIPILAIFDCWFFFQNIIR